MTSFAGNLVLDFGDFSELRRDPPGYDLGRYAITVTPISWRGFILPAGYVSDGASLPRVLWWFLPPWGDRTTLAAVMHDWLCETQTDVLTRADCDRLFRECLIDLRVERWLAWVCWAGVRIGSAVHRLGGAQ